MQGHREWRRIEEVKSILHSILKCFYFFDSFQQVNHNQVHFHIHIEYIREENLFLHVGDYFPQFYSLRFESFHFSLKPAILTQIEMSVYFVRDVNQICWIQAVACYRILNKLILQIIHGGLKWSAAIFHLCRPISCTFPMSVHFQVIQKRAYRR